MLRRSIVLRSALLTARDLVGGLLIGGGAGALIDGIGRSAPTLARVLAVLVTTIVLIVSARIWGSDIERLATGSNPGAAGRAAAFTVAPIVVVVALALAGLEPMVVRRGARSGLDIRVVYALLFVPATLLIAGIGAFALGFGLYRAAFGMRLAIAAGGAAAAAFLTVDLLMDAFGWRVGAPDAGRRATMVVVTALGLVAAAIGAGGAIGALLPRSVTRPT
jgi:hypothetical protein